MKIAELKTYSVYFLILVYVSGAIGWPFYPNFFAPFTPYTLLLTAFVFLWHQPYSNKNFVFGFVSVCIIGYLSEFIGIRTGLVFGDYYYGHALGYKLFGVPLTISLNWALLVNAGLLVSHAVIKHSLLTPVISSALITGVDMIIEHSAGKLDFWYFKEGLAGWHNYLGWFIVALLASCFFYPHLKNGDSKMALLVILLQVLFFGSFLLLNSLHLT